MDLQSESSVPPPCDPQPSGKINKAAFKLFAKRKSGSTVPSIFSVRSKGEGVKGLAKPPLVRSKTHNGLADTSVLEGGKKEALASGDQTNTTGEPGSMLPGPRAPVSKSLSFFSLLRRGGRGTAAVETRPPRQRKGLRGLFGSMRWKRRDKNGRGAEPGAVLLASRSNSVEIVKEDIPLTLEPQPRVLETVALETGEGSAEPAERPGDAVGDSGSGAATPGDQRSQEVMREACPVQEQSPTPCSPTPAVPPLSQESPVLSPLKVTKVASRPKHSSSPETRLLSRTPVMTITAPEPSVSEPSMDRLCSMFTDVTSLKSFDSLTGCGDIIADTEEEGASASGSSSGTGSSSGGTGGGMRGAGGAALSGERPSPIRTPAPPISAAPAHPIVRTAGLPTAAPPPASAVLKARVASVKPQGSGVVAYMGGGEEMASPDEVDDADMQGLWHMLPQKGEDSPALPWGDPAHHTGPRAEKHPPPMKALGLSKIPMGGSGGRVGRHPRQTPPEDVRGKDPQDAPANSDEGYWDSTTPGPEEEDSARFLLRDGLPQGSCSGDALYDLYVDPPEGGLASDEEMTPPASSSSTSGRSKLNPPSQATSFRSAKGSTSLPRDSRIPISVKQTPPYHSASQGALALAATATTPTSPATPMTASASVGKADTPAGTKIPISKVPIRRTSNKPISTRYAPGHAPHRK